LWKTIFLTGPERCQLLEHHQISKQQLLFGFIGLLATIAGFLSKTVYRKYIIANSIDDFGLAGLLPSYFYVVGFSLLLLMRLNGIPRLTILLVTFSSVLFEFGQYVSTNVFDFFDVLASLAGGLTSTLIVNRVKQRPTDAAEQP
jgi:hypothetical protein